MRGTLHRSTNRPVGKLLEAAALARRLKRGLLLPVLLLLVLLAGLGVPPRRSPRSAS